MGSPVVSVSPRKSPLSGRRQGAQVSRLEKADILEMTVKYLRQIQRQHMTVAGTSESDVVAKFSAGYTECASEVIRYMDSVQSLAPDVKTRLESHLVERLRDSVPVTNPLTSNADINQVAAFMTPGNLVNDVYSRHVSSSSSAPEDINRHYQTAIDLANMASSVAAKEIVLHPTAVSSTSNQLQSHLRPTHPPSVPSPPKVLTTTGIPVTFCTNTLSKCTPLSAAVYTDSDRYRSKCTPLSAAVYTDSSDRYRSKSTDIIESHCISPETIRHSEHAPTIMVSSASSLHSDEDTRQGHQCIETAVSHLSYPSSSSTNVVVVEPVSEGCDFNNNIVNNCQSKNVSNINDYLSNFQQPLHIYIPGSPQPRPQSSQSPPFLQPHVAYPHEQNQSTVGTTHAFDDAPETILYGCHGYHITAQDNSSPESTEEFHIEQSTTVTANETNSELSHYCGSNFVNNINNHNNYCNNISRNYIDKRESKMESTLVGSNFRTVGDVYHRQVQETVPSHGIRTTPSPPTLLPEESYVPGDSYHTQRQDIHSSHPYINNYGDVSHKERTVSPECRVDFSTNLPSKYEQFHERQTGNIGHNNVEFQQPKYETVSNYSYRQNDSQTFKLARECNYEQKPLAHVYNSQCRIVGPGLPPSVPSRQNDRSLSPPVLKRRLLLAQGSEGDWTTPRCNGANTDKRIRDDAGLRLTECGQNTRFWRDGHDSYWPFSRERNSSVPAVLLCTGPTHVVSADDGLWRPW